MPHIYITQYVTGILQIILEGNQSFKDRDYMLALSAILKQNEKAKRILYTKNATLYTAIIRRRYSYTFVVSRTECRLFSKIK